mgnify:CR=1 FL=1
MKKLTVITLALVAALSLFGLDVSAQGILIDDGDCPSGVCANTTFGGSLRQAILTVINFALFFLGIIAVAFIIFAGYLYLTSRGEDGQVEKAKKTILYAVIGIVIVLLSFAIVRTITEVATGVRPV